MRACLRDADGAYPIDLVDLDASVRRGLLPGDAELKYPPWTGTDFCRLRDLPQLADALSTPDARFADHLRQRRPTWLTAAVAAMVMGAAMFQSALTSSAQPRAAQRLGQTFHRWMVGLEPTLLDGAWWTLWASQLSHTDLLHALFNVSIIAYCGYRVEQALAPSGALAVIAAAILCGSIAIIGLDDVPVLGSSIMAYGLWAAQIVIGLRMGDAVPQALRGRYGMGNFIFFAPLYAAGLFNPSASHLGHAGGIIGGALVAFFLTAETMAGPKRHSAVRARVLSLIGALFLAPVLLLAAAAHAPGVAYGPYTDHLSASDGVRVRLPSRMVSQPVSVGGLSGWRPSANGREPLFLELSYAPSPAPSVAVWWGAHLSGPTHVLTAPVPLGPGWKSSAVQVGHWTVEEHRLRRGHWLLRAGFAIRSPVSPLAGRRRLYDSILSSIEVLELPGLAAARARWELSPQTSALQLEYARQLRYADQPSEAETLLASAVLTPATLSERLTLWREHPSVQPEEAATVLLAYAHAEPASRAPVLRWLVEHDHCSAASQLSGMDPAFMARCPTN